MENLRTIKQNVNINPQKNGPGLKISSPLIICDRAQKLVFYQYSNNAKQEPSVSKILIKLFNIVSETVSTSPLDALQ